MSTVQPSLTASQTAIRPDLANAPVLVSGNRFHGGLDIIYRHVDGNIRRSDPELRPTRRMRHGGN